MTAVLFSAPATSSASPHASSWPFGGCPTGEGGGRERESQTLGCRPRFAAGWLAHSSLGKLEGPLVSLDFEQFNNPPLVGRHSTHLPHHVANKLHALAQKLDERTHYSNKSTSNMPNFYAVTYFTIPRPLGTYPRLYIARSCTPHSPRGVWKAAASAVVW